MRSLILELLSEGYRKSCTNKQYKKEFRRFVKIFNRNSYFRLRLIPQHVNGFANAFPDPFIEDKGVVSQKRRRSRKLKFFSKHYISPSKEILGAHHFNFAPTFYRNCSLSRKCCILMKIFRHITQFFVSQQFGKKQRPFLLPGDDATDRKVLF